MSIHHAPPPSRARADSHGRRAREDADDPYLDGYADLDDEWSSSAPASQILWGRVAILGAALLIAFLLGRMTAGDNAEALTAAEERIADLNGELEQTRAQLDAVRAGGMSGPATGAESSGADASAADGESSEANADSDAGGDASAADDSAQDAADEQASDSGGESAAQGESYTVEAGDNLFGLAEQFYGDGQQWRHIAETNGLPAGAVLEPGQELTIPPAPSE